MGVMGARRVAAARLRVVTCGVVDEFQLQSSSSSSPCSFGGSTGALVDFAAALFALGGALRTVTVVVTVSTTSSGVAGAAAGVAPVARAARFGLAFAFAAGLGGSTAVALELLSS